MRLPAQVEPSPATQGSPTVADSPPKSQPSLRQLGHDLRTLAQRMDRLSHAAVAMVVAAALDQLLESALLTKFNTSNREIRDKLFGDFGALRSFSAKIDLSFALGLVDRDTYGQLTAIRKMRNLFAPHRGIPKL